MSTLSSIYDSIRKIFSSPFYIGSSLLSYIGLIIVFVSDKNAVLISLITFCLCIVIFTAFLIFALFKIVNIKSAQENSNLTTVIKYSTSNSRNIIYETYKTIQCKRAIMTEKSYGFKWSGSISPVVSSDMQEVLSVMNTADPTIFDQAILKFRKPLYYNQTTVLHFRAHLDDHDNSSSPHVMCKVDQEINLIHFRVTLQHKPRNYNVSATLQRQKINSQVNAPYEDLRIVPFELSSKTYECYIPTPDVGYYYRVFWTK